MESQSASNSSDSEQSGIEDLEGDDTVSEIDEEDMFDFFTGEAQAPPDVHLTEPGAPSLLSMEKLSSGESLPDKGSCIIEDVAAPHSQRRCLPRPHIWPFLRNSDGFGLRVHVPGTRSPWDLSHLGENAMTEYIRVLTINAIQDGGPKSLKCHLHLTRLAKPCNYMALSYAWGSEEAIDELEIDGYRVSVKPTVKSALLQVRQHWYSTSDLHRGDDEPCVWVDSICIQQADDEEKNAQVGVMGEIFSNAQCVLIWLGELKWEGHAQAESLASVNGPPENANIYHLIKQRCFVDHLKMKPWGFRLWTVQEFLLQEQRWVLYGPWMFNFSHLEPRIVEKRRKYTTLV